MFLRKTDTVETITWIHIVVALMCLPMYKYAGPSFKFFIVPYIGYLVLSKKAEYFPALLLHFIFGSIVSSAMLICCLILAARNRIVFKQNRLMLVYYLALLPIPILAYQTYERIFIMGQGLVDIVVPINMALGVYAFFYGYIVAEKLTVEILEKVLLVLGLCLFYRSTRVNTLYPKLLGRWLKINLLNERTFVGSRHSNSQSTP